MLIAVAAGQLILRLGLSACELRWLQRICPIDPALWLLLLVPLCVGVTTWVLKGSPRQAAGAGGLCFVAPMLFDGFPTFHVRILAVAVLWTLVAFATHCALSWSLTRETRFGKRVEVGAASV